MELDRDAALEAYIMQGIDLSITSLETVINDVVLDPHYAILWADNCMETYPDECTAYRTYWQYIWRLAQQVLEHTEEGGQI